MSETTSEVETVTIEVKYVRGAHRRGSETFDPDEDEELFHLTRELSRGSDALEGRDVEDVLERAYVTLCEPVEIPIAPLDVDDDLEAIVDMVYRKCQGAAVSATFQYDGREWRSMSVGDVVVVDGTPVMIEPFGLEVLDVEDDEPEILEITGEVLTDWQPADPPSYVETDE